MPKTGKLQTIIVQKSDVINTQAKARKLVMDTVPDAVTDKVDEKENTYRFRQQPPGRFVKGKYRTKKVPRSYGQVNLVYGTLKKKKAKKK